MLARAAHAVIDVDLTPWSREPSWARALVPVDHVSAYTTVLARVRFALIHINLTLRASKPWHAHASESSGVVKAGSFIFAGMRVALIHIGLAPWPCKTLWAIAGERSGSVDANSIVFAWRSLFTFVDVFGTIDSFVAGSTRTSVRTIDRACVAYGIGVTRIRRARVVKVAQETGLAVRALAMEAANSVDTSGAVETGSSGTIVNVYRTVLSGPAVYTNTIVRSQRIGTCRAVVADAGPHGALVHVHLARLTRPLGRT